MIPQQIQDNLNTIVRAAANGDLAVIETKDAKSGEVRYVIAAINRDLGDGTDDVEIVPFGHLSTNPYEEYAEPEVE